MMMLPTQAGYVAMPKIPGLEGDKAVCIHYLTKLSPLGSGLLKDDTGCIGNISGFNVYPGTITIDSMIWGDLRVRCPYCRNGDRLPRSYASSDIFAICNSCRFVYVSVVVPKTYQDLVLPFVEELPITEWQVDPRRPGQSVYHF